MSVASHISRPHHLHPFFLAALALSSLVLGSPFGAAGQEERTPEVTSKEEKPSFKVQVERNLTLVRVVVRDSHGRPVGSLQKENFRLTDNGKPQTISHFSVEVPSAKVPSPASATPAEPDEETDEPTPGAVPERYLALFFDNVHMTPDDVIRTRQAAEHFLANSLQPSNRVAISTSSGQHQLDFTDDRGKLHEALRELLPRPVVVHRERECPEVSDYQGYMIVHQREPYALEAAIDEAMACNPQITALSQFLPPDQVRAAAQVVVETEAHRALNEFQTETEYALRSVDNLVRRMAALPGQRTIVLVSPGFLVLTAEYRVNEIVDRALKSNVVINTLDAKGLYAHIPLGDASRDPVIPQSSAMLVGKKAQLDVNRVSAIGEVLETLADDTGGVFFHNNNDLDEGFRKVASLPEAYYVLAFSPQNLKYDGKFHKLKVRLNTRDKYTIQAREGYFAPEKPADPASQAKEEIEQAIFSQDEVSELPIAVNTQFFRLNDTQVKLSVLTHLDLKLMQFRKENGRNLNNLTIVTVLFDRDGKIVTGKEKRVEFKLLDGSLEKLSQSGLTSKTSFDIPPGTYMIRQVVRDSEGAQLSALNRTVEIPL